MILFPVAEPVEAAATVSVQSDVPVLIAGFDEVGDEIDDEIREIFPKIKTARDGWSAELGFDED